MGGRLEYIRMLKYGYMMGCGRGKEKVGHYEHSGSYDIIKSAYIEQGVLESQDAMRDFVKDISAAILFSRAGRVRCKHMGDGGFITKIYK